MSKQALFALCNPQKLGKKSEKKFLQLKCDYWSKNLYYGIHFKRSDLLHSKTA